MSALDDYAGPIGLCRTGITRMERGDAGFQFMAMDEALHRAVIALADELAEQKSANTDLGAEYELVRDNLIEALAEGREMQLDTELGKLVRQMPLGFALTHHKDFDTLVRGWWAGRKIYNLISLRDMEALETPEAALRKNLPKAALRKALGDE